MAQIDNYILVTWDPPASLTNAGATYADVQSYEIVHQVPGFESPVTVSRAQTEFTFKNVPEGVYTISVRTVNVLGKKSPYVTKTISTQTQEEVNRTTLNIPRGGTLNTGMYLDKNTAGLLKLVNDDYTFTPPTRDIADSVSIENGTTAQTQQQFSLSDGEDSYLYFDYSAAGSDPLKAVDYFDYGTSGITWIKEVTDNSGVTAISGTVDLPVNTSTIVGTGTSFTSDYLVGERILIGTTFGARVTDIISDTELDIDRTHDSAFSGASAFKFSFEIDYELDSLLARVYRTGGEYYIEGHSVMDSAGAAGLSTRDVEGVLYYTATGPAGPTGPARPTSSTTYSYDFDDSTFNNIATGWSHTPPAIDGDVPLPIWGSRYYVYDKINDNQSVNFSNTFKAISTLNLDKKNVTSFLFYTPSSVNPPTKPSTANTNAYDFFSGTFSNILTDWSHEPPSLDAASDDPFWATKFTVVQNGAGEQTIAFSDSFEWFDLQGLADVATSGDFTDLLNIPDGTGVSYDAVGNTFDLDINELTTETNFDSTDLLAVYDVDAGAVVKGTISDVALVGPTGPSGAQGPTGADGIQGPPGEQGEARTNRIRCNRACRMLMQILTGPTGNTGPARTCRELLSWP
jgi:hypothetical protein